MMRLRDIITAVRNYPRSQAELEQAKSDYAIVQSEHTRLKATHSEMMNVGYAQQHDLDQCKRENEAYFSALRGYCPTPESSEQLQKLYECVAPCLDNEGFILYHTAENLTGFNLYAAFPTEDNLGLFEEANGHQLMEYLTADRFGKVEYEIHCSCYEKAVSMKTDKASPQYQAFERQLYLNVLKTLGFGELLPKDTLQKAEPQKKNQKKAKQKEIVQYEPER